MRTLRPRTTSSSKRPSGTISTPKPTKSQPFTNSSVFNGRVRKPRVSHATRATKAAAIAVAESVIEISDTESEQTNPPAVDPVPCSPIPNFNPHANVDEPIICPNQNSPVASPAPAPLPTPPLARSLEFNRIRALLTLALIPENTPASLYVCGTPGTGKTFTVTRVTDSLCFPSGSTPKIISINCANLQSPKHLFSALTSALNIDAKGDARAAIRNFATSEGDRVVIVLDEVDFLVGRDQLVLYAVFEWAHFENSRIITVGIANAIDLPVRLLPWLRANGCMPEVIGFGPYDANSLIGIVKEHIKVDQGGKILSDLAVGLAAKKVAAGSGDARLVLDVCRESVQKVRDVGGNDVAVVARVMQKRGGRGRVVELVRELPVQQQLALCVAANAVRLGGKKRVGLGGLYDSFVRMCDRSRVGSVRFNEFVDIVCGALAHHGLVEVVEGKRGRGKKRGSLEERLVRLSAPVEDIRDGLEGKAFLPLLIAR